MFRRLVGHRLAIYIEKQKDDFYANNAISIFFSPCEILHFELLLHKLFSFTEYV
jgi:hypothetical protein